MIRRPPRSPLFPSPTLSRSGPPKYARACSGTGSSPKAASACSLTTRVAAPSRDLFSAASEQADAAFGDDPGDRKSTRLNSSHQIISYAVFCLKKKKTKWMQKDKHSRQERGIVLSTDGVVNLGSISRMPQFTPRAQFYAHLLAIVAHHHLRRH